MHFPPRLHHGLVRQAQSHLCISAPERRVQLHLDSKRLLDLDRPEATSLLSPQALQPPRLLSNYSLAAPRRQSRRISTVVHRPSLDPQTSQTRWDIEATDSAPRQHHLANSRTWWPVRAHHLPRWLAPASVRASSRCRATIIATEEISVTMTQSTHGHQVVRFKWTSSELPTEVQDTRVRCQIGDLRRPLCRRSGTLRRQRARYQTMTPRRMGS